MARSAILNVMVHAAVKAGSRLMRDFGEIQNLQISLKGPENYVSQANRNAEQTILKELQHAKPHYSLLIEGSKEIIKGNDDQHCFIVDPLDGMVNFLHGIPFFAVSIGLESQKQMIAGVIYNPALHDLFTTEKGRGAFLNDRRLRVAGRNKLMESLIATSVPHSGKKSKERYFVEMHNIILEVAGIRCTGCTSIDLAYVAAGNFDGYWNHGIKPWNTAAGIIMIREAGGFVYDDIGGQNIFSRSSIIAGNEFIYNSLLRALHKQSE